MHMEPLARELLKAGAEVDKATSQVSLLLIVLQETKNSRFQFIF